MIPKLIICIYFSIQLILTTGKYKKKYFSGNIVTRYVENTMHLLLFKDYRAFWNDWSPTCNFLKLTVLPNEKIIFPLLLWNQNDSKFYFHQHFCTYTKIFSYQQALNCAFLKLTVIWTNVKFEIKLSCQLRIHIVTETVDFINFVYIYKVFLKSLKSIPYKPVKT